MSRRRESILTAGDSPVSNNGRGLKLLDPWQKFWTAVDSPVSNNGRGLKQDKDRQGVLEWLAIRPLAITGVD